MGQGVRRSVWDPETFAPGQMSRAEARPTGRAVFRERLGDCDGPMAVCAPLCLPTRQAGHMAKRRVGVEYSPSMLEPVSPGAVSPDRALCLPTFSHFVIVNKTFLSLSLARDCKKASTTTFCCRRQSIMWQERASRVSGTSHCTNWQGLLYLSPRHLHRASNPAAIRRSPPTTARASGGEPCTFLETLRFFLTFGGRNIL